MMSRASSASDAVVRPIRVGLDGPIARWARGAGGAAEMRGGARGAGGAVRRAGGGGPPSGGSGERGPPGSGRVGGFGGRSADEAASEQRGRATRAAWGEGAPTERACAGVRGA